MSLNSNKTFMGSRCLTVVTTMAQDDYDEIHMDYIKNVMSEGGILIRK